MNRIRKALHTTINLKNSYGPKAVFKAINNKLHGRILLNGIENTSAANEPYYNRPAMDKKGNEILERQHTEFLPAEYKDACQNLAMQPLLSILMPVYNADPHYLEVAIESIRKQYYSNWELCLTDDKSTDTRCVKYLQRIAKEDKRIKFQIAEKNCGIAVTTNKCFDISSGSYLLFMDQDDEIPADALYWFVKEINDHPQADFIYSDECKINKEGDCFDFAFKPDWSPYLLLNNMYTGHLTAYSRDLMGKVGKLNPEFDFSQDYDYALRAGERAQCVRHIERLLYFWRTLPTSGAAGGKDFARISNLNAVANWYKRQGFKVIPYPYECANYCNIVLEKLPLVSIIIPTDSLENLLRTIDAIIRTTVYTNYQIIPVTNSKVAKEVVQNYPDSWWLQICIFDDEYNFSSKCNHGAAIADGEILCFYNDDVTPSMQGWLNKLVESLMLPKVAGVSPMLQYENGAIQYAGMISGTPGLFGTSFHMVTVNRAVHNRMNQMLQRNISILSGAVCAVWREQFNEVGGFDEKNTPNGQSDVDLSFKLRQHGYYCLYTPYSILTHIGNHLWHEPQKVDKSGIYCLKYWPEFTARDPYFPDLLRCVLCNDFSYHYKIHLPAEYSFKKEGKDILIVSHELTRSGAPGILREVVRFLVERGDFVVVTSPVDGPLRSEFQNLGAYVIIDEGIHRNPNMLKSFACNFDVVFVNTIACAQIISVLNDSLPKVVWWIHEGQTAFDYFKGLMPKKIGANVHAYAVSNYSRDVFVNNGYTYIQNILHWGIKEAQPAQQSLTPDKPMFMMVGAIEKRKGQDVFLKAIELLSEQDRNNCQFLIVGRDNEPETAALVEQYCHEYSNIVWMKHVSDSELAAFYEQAICAVIPSRDDPLPIIGAEIARLKKPFIVSDKTGYTDILEGELSQLIFESENSAQLAEKISSLLRDSQKLHELGMLAFDMFKTHFEYNRFRQRILDAIDESPIGNQ